MFTEKGELKSSSLLDRKKGKRQPAREKSTTDKKERLAYSKLRVMI
jgi:hypothetical protein